MAITAKQVKELREMTGAGPLDCKKALEENGGDVEAAAEYLRQKGIASAKKKLGKDRSMNEGIVEVYQHHNGRLAVMVEVNCETDFVANTEQFRNFAKDVALHIISMSPEYVKREDVPADLIEAERNALLQQDDMQGKPEDIKAKIVEGRLDKWYKDIVLMEQDFLKDDSVTIAQLLENVVSEIGEKVQIARFARYELGGTGEDAGEDEE